MFVIRSRRTASGGEQTGPVDVMAYVERADAKSHLEELIALHEISGWDAKQDYWWVREGPSLTRYTIEAVDTEPKT